MGEVSIITKEQQIILDEVTQSELLRSTFYFTGGTALSAIYLHHRLSDDLDFFSQKHLDQEVLFNLMQSWSKKHHFIFTSRFVDVVYIFLLTFSDNTQLKVDFASYPYRKLAEEKQFLGMSVDSLLDIAVNKLLTVQQRTDVKDFVDLYFLLPKFSLWDLREGVMAKFNVEMEPLLLGADFLKAESFDYLPKMILPLTLDKLKSFFRHKAQEVGRKSVI